MPEHQLTRWYTRGALLTARPAAGAGGLCLLVEDGDEHAVGRVLDLGTGAVGPVLPFDVGFDSLLSPDGQWVVSLDDDGGSEVGRLVAQRTDGSETRVLTPDRESVVLRGLEISADGRNVLATVVDDDGHHVILIPIHDPASTSALLSSTEETWLAHISADSAYVCADTCDHNPGVRRPAVTVVEVVSGDVVGVADDLPDGPIRAVRFSTIPGDQRVLLSTERSGFARPSIWTSLTGERRDYALTELSGETLVLDWHAETGTILWSTPPPAVIGCSRSTSTPVCSA